MTDNEMIHQMFSADEMENRIHSFMRMVEMHKNRALFIREGSAFLCKKEKTIKIHQMY